MDIGSVNYKRFLNGDNAGLEEIIRTYRDGLIFYLYSIVGSLSQAEEIAEDTFVLLCVKKPKDNQKSSFKTWLYTIGRNLAIDALRRNSRHATVPLDTYNNIENEEETLEEMYLRNSKKQLLHKALEKLKPEYRQTLWLIYFEELSYKEVAQIIHKNIHATEMLVSRARQALKLELNKEGIINEDY